MLDEMSEICDFYPKDFYVDTKGKRFAWMGEVILPFIEEDRLLKAIKKYESEFTKEENERNKLGHTFVIVHENNELVQALKERHPDGKYKVPDFSE